MKEIDSFMNNTEDHIDVLKDDENDEEYESSDEYENDEEYESSDEYESDYDNENREKYTFYIRSSKDIDSQLKLTPCLRISNIRRDVGGIVDEGLKAPKKQSACLIASQSDNLRSPDTSVGMREGQSPGSITSGKRGNDDAGVKALKRHNATGASLLPHSYGCVRTSSSNISSSGDLVANQTDNGLSPDATGMMSVESKPKFDSVVSSIIKKLEYRANFGKKKYGTDLDREDLTFLDWIQHAQEEHMDAILYLEKIKQTEEKRLSSTSSSLSLSTQETTIYPFMIIYILTVLCLLLSMNHIFEKLPF